MPLNSPAGITYSSQYAPAASADLRIIGQIDKGKTTVFGENPDGLGNARGLVSNIPDFVDAGT
ncbi:hypothetical protein [Bifidobacterium sp.]|uniref:hypothetical protein n=1 Tax=Bifidobacterium sp. TaxID=41200 RepID=UPI0025BAFC40|nr:hypothetical protein [Bifidobacterium sp.]MCH4208738.1 hypothetical protein [Bifidobacterium sp.]MCI1223998.1 hypothetical protein [Bifidobacterium sp.]